jgi:hypothetical protein
LRRSSVQRMQLLSIRTFRKKFSGNSAFCRPMLPARLSFSIIRCSDFGSTCERWPPARWTTCQTRQKRKFSKLT